MERGPAGTFNIVCAFASALTLHIFHDNAPDVGK
jgi:hypothetical protein